MGSIIPLQGSIQQPMSMGQKYNNELLFWYTYKAHTYSENAPDTSTHDCGILHALFQNQTNTEPLKPGQPHRHEQKSM